MQLLSIELTIIVCIYLSSKKLLPVTYIVPKFKNLLSIIYLLKATDTDNCKKLLNLAKIYINNINNISCNSSFKYKLGILYDICSKTDILPKTKLKRFFIILKYLAFDKYPLNINISNTIMNSNYICY